MGNSIYLIRIRPEQVAQESLIWDVCGPHDPPESKKRRVKKADGAKRRAGAKGSNTNVFSGCNFYGSFWKKITLVNKKLGMGYLKHDTQVKYSLSP